MRFSGIVAAVTLLCLSGVSVIGEETTPQAANLSLKLTPGQVLRYALKIQATGTTKTAGDKQPTSLDTTIDIAMSYTVGEPAKDGTVQVTIAPESVSAVVDGYKMELPNSYVPKIVVLINSKGEVTNLFSSDPSVAKLPGLNSRNLILLFLPNAPSGDLKPGATWKKTMSLPPEPESYALSYRLEGLEEASGIATAKVKTDLVVQPPDGADYSAKGFAITNYALDDVRLIKSHAEMTVKVEYETSASSSESEQSEILEQIEAVVKVDIQLTSGVELVK